MGLISVFKGQETRPYNRVNGNDKSSFPLSDSTFTILHDTILFLLDTVSEDVENGGKGVASSFYKTLQRSAYKRKFTKELYHLFFVSPDRIAPNEPINTEQSETPFAQYQGKTIRNIRFKILQPFGAKLYDTTRTAKSWLEKKGNQLHTTTRIRNLRKQLHIKCGDKLSALSLADNERLIRELPYVEDAFLQVIPVQNSSTMVDLELLVKDQFSWGANMSVSSISSTDFEIYNKNLYGLGHQINNTFEYDSQKNKRYGYTGQYFIKNIGGSYINTGFTYQNNFKKNVIQIDADKKFETFNTRYAGGISFSRTMRSNKILPNDPILSEIPLNFNYSNVWIGRSFKLKSRNIFTRKKLVLAAKIAGKKFFKRPPVSLKENNFFHNNTLYLTSFSFSQAQYYKSNLIFNFGHTEDIPYGNLAEITFGYENREFSHRSYAGINLEKAIFFYNSKRYLFNRLALGSFLYKNQFQQGLITAQTKFVSGLKRLGRYRFRNFVEMKYMLGVKRFPEEFIDINNRDGIRGFDSEIAQGNQKLALSFENAAFSPYLMGGFRLTAFTFADIGIIGQNDHFIFDENFYFGLGFGVRLRNENIVFKTIQLRLTFYPKTPADFNNTEFKLSGETRPRFNDFNINQPQVLEYR